MNDSLKPGESYYLTNHSYEESSLFPEWTIAWGWGYGTENYEYFCLKDGSVSYDSAGNKLWKEQGLAYKICKKLSWRFQGSTYFASTLTNLNLNDLSIVESVFVNRLIFLHSTFYAISLCCKFCLPLLLFS